MKGRFTPRNPKKYVGDVRHITYRSSYELKFMNWCDLNDSVVKWNSEEIVVNYISPVDNRPHRYFVDFTIQVKEKDDNALKTYMVEVKPFRYTQEPQPPQRKTKSFLQEVVQWHVNQSKWKAAAAFAKERGWDFQVITEKELGIRA